VTLLAALEKITLEKRRTLWHYGRMCSGLPCRGSPLVFGFAGGILYG
jgi:hypothetical protein